MLEHMTPVVPLYAMILDTNRGIILNKVEHIVLLLLINSQSQHNTFFTTEGLPNANFACGLKKVRRLTGHVAMAPRYSNHEVSGSDANYLRSPNN